MLAIGVGMVIKTEWLIQNMGTNEWAETKMGTFGGSRMMYKLIGIVLVFLGFTILFNLQDGLLNATFGKLIV